MMDHNNDCSDSEELEEAGQGVMRDHNPNQQPYKRSYHRAKTYFGSYEESNSMEALEQSISLYRRTLSLYPEHAAGRDDVLFDLALALYERYQSLGSSNDLHECIDLFQKALDLRPPGHPDRDPSLSNLGNALGSRYDRYGGDDDLKLQIELYTESLELCPPGHPERAASLINLGGAIGERYRSYDRDSDLQKRIELCREALELCPPGHSHRDSSLNELGNALGDRYSRFGEEEDLQAQIELYAEALELRLPGNPLRDTSLHNLGNALGDRYARFGAEDDLEKRIELGTESLELCPPGHPFRQACLTNLGIALGDRYASRGEEDDLKKQIDLCKESLELCPPGHPSRAGSLNNLGNALSCRYTLFNEEADLSAQIELYTESLELRPPGNPLRERSLNNLASALNERYNRYGGEEDLNTQIGLYAESLELCLPGHPGRADSIINLGNALGDRYTRYGKEKDLSEAVSLLEGEVDSVVSTEGGMLRCALTWVDLAGKFSHESLGRAFVKAVGCLRRYLSIGPTAELQYKAILQQTRLLSLATDAAAYFIDMGELEQAIELLDEGRSLLWSEMRRFREPLSSIYKERIGEPLSTQYDRICKDIWDLSNAEVRFRNYSASNVSSEVVGTGAVYDEVLKKKREKTKEYIELLRQIRDLPDCENFQRGRRFAELQTAAEEGPVVIVNCSERRSDAIIIFAKQEPYLMRLEDNFRTEMLKVHKRYTEGLEDGCSDRKFDFSEVLKEVAAALWDRVAHAVVERLGEAGISNGSRIWWCPTSFLTSLPIHAAGVGSNFLADHFVSSYTPTLSALIDARRPVADSSSPRILVVAQTKLSGMPMAEEELRRMMRMGSNVECVDNEQATPAAVLTSLPNFDWVHFICHGTVSENPFQSSLILHDMGRLSLHDIIKAHLPDAKFAFLAACHSAELNWGEVLQDEVLHLAAAMQFSGFRSVVGTMWQMADRDGPFLAEAFYKEMLAEDGEARLKHTRAARALWKTVQVIRKRVPMERWASFVHIGA